MTITRDSLCVVEEPGDNFYIMRSPPRAWDTLTADEYAYIEEIIRLLKGYRQIYAPREWHASTSARITVYDSLEYSVSVRDIYWAGVPQGLMAIIEHLDLMTQTIPVQAREKGNFR
jgi:hypothetical protein